VAEPGELSGDDDDYGYGLDIDGSGLRRLPQWLVTRKVQSRSRSCTTWITPPRNFLVCRHRPYPHVKAALWSIIPPCHPRHLSNGCLVLVVWLLHREEIGFQMKILSACWCWKRTAVFST